MAITKNIQTYVEVIEGLHKKWTPHAGQVTVGKVLFNDGIKQIFVQAGRNWGKTELVCYCLWRWANMNPESENYYFSPYMKQSREILWESNRLLRFGPKEWMSGNPNNTEMRMRFKNGSFIKCDGSDNIDSYRGVKPRGLVVFDEFKDFRPEFYEAFEPNRAAYDSPIIIIGTPPGREGQFLKLAEDFRNSKHKKFFKAPSEQNHYLSKKWLEDQRDALIKRGEEDVWQREYLAEYVPGGVTKIFPMLSKKCCWTCEKIWEDIRRDLKKLNWYLVADPAAATVFAVLFVVINPYTKIIYCLDEIYEMDQGLMSVEQIGNRINEKKQELYPRGEWVQVYDEAETWFRSEMFDRFGEFYQPTHKSYSKKANGISLIKDVLLGDKLVICDRCEKLFWEMDNYYKDQGDKISKKNDHLIDCLRYTLSAAYYALNAESEPKVKKTGWKKISDDFPALNSIGEPNDELDWEASALWTE